LGDVYETIPCNSHEIPDQVLEDGRIVGFTDLQVPGGGGECVIVVEGMAYGDGLSEEDYAE
jgi:snRNA-activating protein complex subunit 3